MLHQQNTPTPQPRHLKKQLPSKQFDAGFGLRYAEELRQLQQSGHFGAMHQTSHTLEKNDLLLSELVVRGLSNLAQMAFQHSPKHSPQPQPVGRHYTPERQFKK
jgi:hypothetical protein